MSFVTEISTDAPAAAAACGAKILQALTEGIEARRTASLAISGGKTPKILFQWLAGSGYDWSRVHLFWVDERSVPPGDPESNFTLAETHWLTEVNYPRENIHRIRTEQPVSEAAERYADEIRGHFGLQGGALPVFDVIQQGMGADVHTASLFPGEALIEDTTGLAAAVYVEKLKAARVTLLPGVLARARYTLMLVCGEDKQAALEAVFHGPDEVRQFPAQLTRRHQGKVIWYLDAAAAARLA